MKTVSKLLTLFLLGIVCITGVEAQDIHFSQFYASPMTLNPALTGKFSGDYRISAIYRTQWANIVQPFYRTPSASADFSLFKGKLKGDALGVGVVFVNDEQLDRLFNTLRGSVSVAYHKGLGEGNKTQLSAGFQLGYTQKQVEGEFQYEDGFYIDGELQPMYGESLETLTGEKETYLDFNAGLLFNTQLKDNMTLYVGATVFHINTPKEIFLTSTDNNELPMNYVGHGGIEIELKDKWLIIPGFLFQMQAKTRETNFGSTFGYQFKDKETGDPLATVFVGAWYRWNDAIIPKVGLEFKDIRVGVAYDVNVSGLKDVKDAADPFGEFRGNLPTAFEVSVSYIGNLFKPKDDVYLFNPRY